MGLRALRLLGSSMCVTIVCMCECSTCVCMHGHTARPWLWMIASGVAGWPGALFTHHSEVLRRVFSALANISSGVTGSARGGCISSWKASAQEEEEPSSTQGGGRVYSK